MITSSREVLVPDLEGWRSPDFAPRRHRDHYLIAARDEVALNDGNLLPLRDPFDDAFDIAAADRFHLTPAAKRVLSESPVRGRADVIADLVRRRRLVILKPAPAPMYSATKSVRAKAA